MRAQFRFRIRLILGAVLCIAMLVLLRLYFVQIVYGQDYALKADHQFTSGSSGLFDRGSIYFTRKDGTPISAATLATGFLVAINPQTLQDPAAAYTAIAQVASTTVLSHDAFMAAAAKTQQVYIEVAHHLSDAAGKALAAENIQGVEVLRERWRYYPGGELAAHAIGVVGYGSGDTLAGQTGLEAQYDETLARSGDGLYKNFFAQIFSNVGNLLVNAKSAREGDVITTIEPEVETRLEEDLAKVNEQYSSAGSGGIIMIPSTGAVIALGSYPTYDPNDLANANPSLLTNPLVEHVFEFGSIMKPVTMASGLTAGVIQPDSTYTDTGCIHVDAARICNWNYKAYGTIPMLDIIKYSLNVGASYVATQLGQDNFRKYFTELFGNKTGVDLPSETDALIGNLSKPQQVYYDTASFGEGIAVTPMQMVRALGAIANGGKTVTPHLVSAIQLDNGVTRTLDWGPGMQVFTPAAARATTVMMDALWDEELDHGQAKIPTMSVAAKTGTAQLPTPTGTYYTDRFFHSEVAFFPSFNPRFIILLYTDDPKNVTYAAETLTPELVDLVHFLIDYYDVPPDRGIATSTQNLPQ